MTGTKPSSLQYFLLLLVLFAVPLALFGGVGKFEFVNWDDDQYVYENQAIRSLSWNHLKQWFTRPYVKLYVPTAIASYAVDHQLYGNEASGYHRTNLVIHLVNILLVFGILQAVVKEPLVSCLGALLFGVHPAQVESVAWISERKNLLFGFFFLLGFHLWVKKDHAPSKRRPVDWLIPALFLAALLSKITAVVIPFILLAYDYFYGRGVTPRKLLAYASSLFVIVAVGFSTLLLYPKLGTWLSTAGLSQLLLMVFSEFAAYLRIILFPFQLKMFYPAVPDVFRNPWVQQYLVVLAASGSFFLIYACIKRKPYAFWILWYLLFLAPPAFVAAGINNRHAYLPIVGCILMFICTFRRYRRFLVGALAVFNILSLPLAHAQLAHWKNSNSLWKFALASDPSNFRALLQLANHYQEQGAADRAEELYRRMIEYHPGAPYAYTNLANIYLVSGRIDDLKWVAETAQAGFPEHPEAAYISSMAAHAEGDQALAASFLREAAEKGSENSSVYANLALVHFRAEEFSKAIPLFEKAVEINETLAVGHYFLGLSYMAVGEWQKALAVFTRMEERSIMHPGLFYQKGVAYAKLGDQSLARAAFLKSVQAQPEVAEAYFELGRMSLGEGRLEAARGYFQTALRLRPGRKEYADQLEKVDAGLKGHAGGVS